MRRETMHNVLYYGMAILLLPIIIYLFVVIMFGENYTKEIKGCGPRCKGECRMGKNAKRIRDLNIIFVKMEGCIYCKRLEELLAVNNVSELIIRVDSNSDDVKKLSSKYGEINGFPTLISITTGKKIVGARASIEDIIQDLI